MRVIHEFKLSFGNTFGAKSPFFGPWDFEIGQMTSKNNWAPLLCHFKLCTSFRRHLGIQTGVTARKRPIRVKIIECSARVTWKFNDWSRKTKGLIFYVIASFVNDFVALCEFKLELWSGNAEIGTKFVLTSVTLTFDLWPFALLHEHHFCQ